MNRRRHTSIAACLGALATLLTASPSLGAERRYTAELHQSVWYAQSSPQLCELSHPIPLYGMARFQQAANETLIFELVAFDAAVGPGVVLMGSRHPRWNHLAGGNNFGRVQLQSGTTPVKLPHGPALRLLLELENGRQPMFRYHPEADDPEGVAVSLSNVNFADAMQQFRHCVSRLEGNDAVAIARVEVHFALDSAQLDESAHPHLDRVAAKVAADSGVTRVILTGHADPSGATDYNLELSERRALSVLDYLAGRGVEESLLEVVAMGESSAANRHRVAAAQRQVTVEILR